MKAWIFDHRSCLLGALGMAVFSVTVHLGGAYVVYRWLGRGLVFSAISRSLIVVDLPVQLVYYLTGRGLLFEYLELSAVQRVIDLAILFLANYTGWVVLFFGLGFLGRKAVPRLFGAKNQIPPANRVV